MNKSAATLEERSEESTKGLYPKALQYVTYCAVAIVFCGILVTAFLSKSAQWDFNTYYAAAKASAQGLDPYDASNLKRVMGMDVFAFCYPPVTLYLLHPVTWVGCSTAKTLFLVAKLGALGTLAWLWCAIFPFRRHLVLFLPFVLFGFNGTLIEDLRCGNCSMFEQLLVWLGFYFYVRGRVGWFCVAILLAAMAKLTPILCLGVLLLSFERKQWAYFAAACLVFCAEMGASFAIWPDLTRKFFTSAAGVGAEVGIVNPSSWAFVNDLALALHRKTGIVIPGIATASVYAILAGVVVTVVFLAARRLLAMDKSRAVLWRVALMCLMYGMCCPRMKNYSGIILLAPAFFVLLNARLPRPALLAAVIFMQITHREYVSLGRFFAVFYRYYCEYYALWLTAFALALGCYSIFAETRAASGRDGLEERGGRHLPAEPVEAR